MCTPDTARNLEICKINNVRKILLIFLTIIVVVIFFRVQQREKEEVANSKATRMSEKRESTTNQSCTPTTPDGEGPYYLPNQPFRENITTTLEGEKLVV